VAATEARTLWFDHHARNNPEYLAAVFADAILARTIRLRYPVPYFRWFDAGDVSTVYIAEVIRDIARIVHEYATARGQRVWQWLPTHSGDIPGIADILEGLHLYGVNVRPSERDTGTAATLAPDYMARGYAAPTGVWFGH
jgi:hypothetical protein